MAMLAVLAPAEPKDGLTDPDDVPEPPDEPVTKPGDLWLLGVHRLLCGDAGSETDLERHPEKARATHRKMRAKDRPLANDFMSGADFEALLLAGFGNASRVLRPGAASTSGVATRTCPTIRPR